MVVVDIKKQLRMLNETEKQCFLDVLRLLQEGKAVPRSFIKSLRGPINIVSQADMAEVTGATQQQLHAWVLQGCPRNQDCTFDTRKFFEWIKGVFQKRTNSDALEAEQIRKTAAQATLAEIKIAEAEKKLVDREIILRTVGEHITTASKRIQDLPRLLARSIPIDLRKDFIVDAEAEVDQLLMELADNRDLNQRIDETAESVKLLEDEAGQSNGKT